MGVCPDSGVSGKVTNFNISKTESNPGEPPRRTRLQVVVIRDGRLLMVQHRQDGNTWWCLPGGGWQPGESYAEGALRELKEECLVDGKVLELLAHVVFGGRGGQEPGASITFLVEIGDQEPELGYDPEVISGPEILSDVRWMALSEIPERDRAFLWESGLLTVKYFYEEVESWGEATSYPVGSRQG